MDHIDLNKHTIFLGMAAYYWPLDYDQPISYRDKNLMGLLKQRNSSIDERTSYKDIYYSSINEVSFQATGAMHSHCR